jgi:hypothetical protein
MTPVLAWLPYCGQPFVGGVMDPGGSLLDPICPRCFISRGYHRKLDHAAAHPHTPGGKKR